MNGNEILSWEPVSSPDPRLPVFQFMDTKRDFSYQMLKTEDSSACETSFNNFFPFPRQS